MQEYRKDNITKNSETQKNNKKDNTDKEGANKEEAKQEPRDKQDMYNDPGPGYERSQPWLYSNTNGYPPNDMYNDSSPGYERSQPWLYSNPNGHPPNDMMYRRQPYPPNPMYHTLPYYDDFNYHCDPRIYQMPLGPPPQYETQYQRVMPIPEGPYHTRRVFEYPYAAPPIPNVHYQINRGPVHDGPYAVAKGPPCFEDYQSVVPPPDSAHHQPQAGETYPVLSADYYRKCPSIIGSYPPYAASVGYDRKPVSDKGQYIPESRHYNVYNTDHITHPVEHDGFVRHEAGTQGHRLQSSQNNNGNTCSCVVPQGMSCKHIIKRMRPKKVEIDEDYKNNLRHIYHNTQKNMIENRDNDLHRKCSWADYGVKL